MKRDYSGYLYIVLCALIFSSAEIVLKATAGMFRPAQVTGLRFLIGGAVLLPFALRTIRKRGERLTRADVGFFLLLGFLFICMAMMIYQIAITHIPASVVALLFSSNPVFISILAGPILGETVHRDHVAALVIEVLALLVIIDPLHTQLDPLGCLLAICSTLLFALYGVLGKKRSRRLGGVTVTSLSALFGGAELVLLVLLGHTAAGGTLYRSLGLSIMADVPLLGTLTGRSLLWLLYLSVVNTGLGFVFHMLAMEHTSAQTASLVYFLKPMLAPILALLLLREQITRNMWFGIAIFLVGSAVAIVPELLRERKAEKASS